jgi:cell shape-determining protein MreD
VTFLWAVVALGCALAAEILLGSISPSALRYVDVMMLPLIAYALAASQRSAMFVGFAGGLLEDAWFQAGLFGAGGFSKTLLGWALGALGARFELNHVWGRMGAGMLLPVLDRLIELGLRRLFDVPSVAPDPLGLLMSAGAGGLLAVGVLAILERALPRARKATRGVRRSR